MTHRKPLILIAMVAALVAGGAIPSAPFTSRDYLCAAVQLRRRSGGAMKVLEDEPGGRGRQGQDAHSRAHDCRHRARAAGPVPGRHWPGLGVKTDALPAIWTQKPTFDAAAAKLVAEADKLVGLAGSGNKAAVLAQFKAVGGSCAACHRRVPR